LIARFVLLASIAEAQFPLLLVKAHQQITAKPDFTARPNQRSKTSSLLLLVITQGKVVHNLLNVKSELTTISGIWAIQIKIIQQLLPENP
jgi:hypothetical protein